MQIPCKAMGLAAALVLTASMAAAQTLNGPNFAIQTYATGPQGAADAAIDSGGHFIVTWAGYTGHDSSYTGIVARRYRSSGAPVGAEFAVNTFTSDEQSLPAVAVDAASGRFVVVWQSWETDGDMYGVNGRLFASNGAPIGGEFQVNTFSAGYQYLPDVAFQPNGTFVVTWQSDDQDGDYYGIVARRFDNNANPLGAEFVVNAYTLGFQYGPRVATNGLGFAVAWEGAGTGDPDGIFARVFTPAGTPHPLLTTDFRVNFTTTNFQRYAAVAASNSAFVVAWEDVSPTLERDVWALRFNSSFTPGLPFQVNTSTTDQQRRPAVGMDNLGQFVITWHDGIYTSASLYDVKGRMFNAAGGDVGTEFTVNSFTTGQQQYPSVAGGRNGNFLVVWEGDQTGSFDVYGQRLGDLIFSDDFETF